MSWRRLSSGPAEAELRLVRDLEGRPRPRPDELAVKAGLGKNGAWRLFNRLRDRGVLRSVTLVDPTVVAGPCECLAYLSVDWRLVEPLALLEAALAEDRRVMEAARLAGTYDYVVRSFHADEYAANTWFRGLLAAAGVLGGELRFCRSILVRCTYARALLNGAPRDDDTT